MASSFLGTGFFQPQARPGGVTVATERLAEEIAPFMQDYLERESALATLRSEGLRDEVTGELVLDPVTGEPIDPGGYKAFTGPTIADFTGEQLAAQRGLTSLAGFETTVDPVTGERTVTETGPGIAGTRFADAEALIRGQQEEFTADTAEKFMSPFQQAVVDIEKREAQQKFEQDVLPKVQAAAIQSGSFGGSRGALLEAEALRGQQQLLGDIQSKGLQSAYDRARQDFEAQKSRERGQAQALIGLSPAETAQRTRELQGLERVGAAQQAQTQTALDEAYKEFLEEQAFPETVLDRMQSAAFGFPALRQEVRQSPTTFGPSPFATLASGVGAIGTGVGSLFGQLGGSRAGKRKHGGIVSRRDGGLVPLVSRQNGNVVYEGERPDFSIPTTEDTPENAMLALLRARKTAQERAAIQREALRKKQAARIEARKARLDERADPLKLFFRGLMQADKMPASGDYRDAGMFGGLNLPAIAQDIDTRKSTLEKEYKTLEERDEDTRIAAMQADIDRMEQQAEQDIKDEERLQQFNIRERTANLAELTQKTNEELKRQELSILSDAELNKLTIARLERARKNRKDEKEFDLKVTRLGVEIGKLKQSIGEAQAKILNSNEFKDLLANSEFRLAEEAARRAGIDVDTIKYLRNILTQENKTKVESASQTSPPTDPVDMEKTIRNLEEQAKRLRK
tara:strand:+ start:1045 stop:3099 length:2055 start_codon:yes stop_codon:yes gene_type:complete